TLTPSPAGQSRRSTSVSSHHPAPPCLPPFQLCCSAPLGARVPSRRRHTLAACCHTRPCAVSCPGPDVEDSRSSIAPRTLTRGLKDPAASTLSAVAPPPCGNFPPFLRCAPEKRGEEEKERKEEKKGRKEEEAATKGRRMPPHPGASPFPALRPRRRRPLSPLKRKESGRSPPPTLGTPTSSSSLPIASSYSDIEPAQHRTEPAPASPPHCAALSSLCVASPRPQHAFPS
ncbi:unnamed protein product, partial [Urochloa humidicola]